MDELCDANGNWERFAPACELIVPDLVKVSSGGDGLIWGIWDTARTGEDWQRVTLAPPILQEFIALADASAERLADFARRWGMLDLCEHDLPRSHAPCPGQRCGCEYCRLFEGSCCRPTGFQTRELEDGLWIVGIESIAIWRQFARAARAVVKVAESVYRGGVAATDDLTSLLSVRPEPEDFARLSSAEQLVHQCHYLMWEVNWWLRVGDVRPGFNLDADGTQVKPSVRFGQIGPHGSTHFGLFGALAVQLLLAVSRAEAPVSCCYCGGTYLPRRRPRAGERNYCPTCREKKVPALMNQRAHRERQRAAQRDPNSDPNADPNGAG